MFLSDKMDWDPDSSSEQLDGDNESSESELDTNSDDNDWCPVTKRRRRPDSVPEFTFECAKSQSSSTHTGDPETCPIPRSSGERRSTCPIEGCGGKSKHLKHYTWEYLIPRIIWDHPWKGLNNSPDYHRLRASCLNSLAKYILGTGTVQDLVNYVNDKIHLPCKYPIIPRTQHQMGLLTRTICGGRELTPVNSPAVLIHWRILLALVETMTAKDRIDFKSLGREKL